MPKRWFTLLGAVALLALLGTEVPGLDAGVLHLAPALALALPLLWGRYVGEERIAELAAAARSIRPRAEATLQARLPRAPRVTASRGGRLLAASLAERGPPAGQVAAP